MKIKLRELLETQKDVMELLKVKLPVKVSYKISRLSDKTSSEIKEFYKQLEELKKEHGEKKEKGSFQVKPENNEVFFASVEELLDLEVDIDFQKIKVEELGEVNIEPKLLVNYIFE